MRKNGFLTAILTLLSFCSVYFISATGHFFHDILPEEAEGYFFKRSTASTVEFFHLPDKVDIFEDCPFSNFLLTIEKASSSCEFSINLRNDLVGLNPSQNSNPSKSYLLPSISARSPPDSLMV